MCTLHHNLNLAEIVPPLPLTLPDEATRPGLEAQFQRRANQRSCRSQAGREMPWSAGDGRLGPPIPFWAEAAGSRGKQPYRTITPRADRIPHGADLSRALLGEALPWFDVRRAGTKGRALTRRSSGTIHSAPRQTPLLSAGRSTMCGSGDGRQGPSLEFAIVTNGRRAAPSTSIQPHAPSIGRSKEQPFPVRCAPAAHGLPLANRAPITRIRRGMPASAPSFSQYFPG